MNENIKNPDQPFSRKFTLSEIWKYLSDRYPDEEAESETDDSNQNQEKEVS